MAMKDYYRNRRVLVTGHTGFKGSWLAAWLLELGADVLGCSLDVPTVPSNFEAINLKKRLASVECDIRDLGRLKKVFRNFAPEIVFHLAAQAITRRSYDLPQETFHTNLGGTVNILECIQNSASVKAAVIITSDKCYQNLERPHDYTEGDRLGGDDPYSASKACAEIASHSYMRSFFSRKDSPMIATSRAGNVIGGGDWADDRIIPDCVRAFSGKETLVIRNPKATRPWQHVLEPLSGYLWLGVNLLRKNRKVSGESFNFGPSGSEKSVEDLIREFARLWGAGKWRISQKRDRKKEAALLKLNCDKARKILNWHTTLAFSETVRMTVDWYKRFYDREDMHGFAVDQIAEYTELAGRRNLRWTKA